MSNNLNLPKMWIIGSGPMAIAYAKVLEAMSVSFIVVGRGWGSAETFRSGSNAPMVTGGLSAFLEDGPEPADAVIVAVGVEQLAAVTSLLLDYGIKRILVEKPAGINGCEISEVSRKASDCQAKVYLGYNRRFFASTLKAEEIIREDGGVESFNFEFTEWGHIIAKLEKLPQIKAQWFLANSTHVVDLAFHLGGAPARWASFTKGELPWHPLASVFAGAGVTGLGALFTYQANWVAPGRWGVELLTRRHRLILRPMEELHIQHLGATSTEQCLIDNTLDLQFKPGLYRQIKEFISIDPSPSLLSLGEHSSRVKNIYEKMLQPEA